MDSRRRTLSRAGSPVVLTPKAFDVLLFLVRNPNRLVTKEELLQAVWGDTFVEDGNLTQYVSHVRKALGESPEGRLILTIPRKGYQFTATVNEMETADAAETLRADVTAFRELAVAPKARWHSRKAAAIAASIILFTTVCFASWRHFREAAPRSRIMVAVLPFENLTGDPNKEYLADGLTEEMISRLGTLNQGHLAVIARTSVMRYKHTDERLDQIERELSVQYVLENSLRESGDHVRITARLIQAKDQTHLWSKDYDYPAKDILNLEDDVTKSVAREIQVRLTSPQPANSGQPRPINPAAFDAYLQGYYFFERNTDQDTEMAAKYYERATQLDPSYALAWAALSRVRKFQTVNGLIPREEGYRAAREMVERALALNPNLAEAHVQMGRMKQQVDFDWVGGDASYQRALQLAPGNPEAVSMAAGSAAQLGRLDEGLELNHRAVNLDPLNANSWLALGQNEYEAGQLDQAVTDIKKALELSPDVFPAPLVLGKIFVLQGRPQDALPEIELLRNDRQGKFLAAIAYHALGREKASETAIAGLVTNPLNAYVIAEIYALRNQFDKAFEWLDRAYVVRDVNLIATKVDPLLKNLQHDPRFAAFLKKLNFPN